MSVAITGVPASSAACASLAASTAGSRLLLPLASFSSRGIAFSSVCRSARISSVWIVSMSLAGFTSPSTWVTSSSRKTRVTWQIAADSRMWDRNLLPSPSPSEAPRTMPAMSTNSTVAGTDPRRAEELGQPRQPLVRHADHADVRLDRRERVVRREHVVLGQRVEERRLAGVGESDDADGESHNENPRSDPPPARHRDGSTRTAARSERTRGSPRR